MGCALMWDQSTDSQASVRMHFVGMCYGLGCHYYVEMCHLSQMQILCTTSTPNLILYIPCAVCMDIFRLHWSSAVTESKSYWYDNPWLDWLFCVGFTNSTLLVSTSYIAHSERYALWMDFIFLFWLIGWANIQNLKLRVWTTNYHQ